MRRDKDGQLDFAKYDLFLSEQLAHFLGRLEAVPGRDGSVLDNTIVLFGSGASTTHNPTQPADPDRRRHEHGFRARHLLAQSQAPMSNLYLSILRSLGVEVPAFCDSTGTLTDSIFTKV